MRCKPCVNPHNTSGTPRYLPAGFTRYILNKYATKSLPFHVTKYSISRPLSVCLLVSSTRSRPWNYYCRHVRDPLIWPLAPFVGARSDLNKYRDQMFVKCLFTRRVCQHQHGTLRLTVFRGKCASERCTAKKIARTATVTFPLDTTSSLRVNGQDTL